jgi:hypothetical protein
VEEILSTAHPKTITHLIGYAESIFALVILSGIARRLIALTQITFILLMNIIEFILVPDLLLFGHGNLLIAICFSFLIYLNEFIYQKPAVGLMSYLKTQPFAIKAWFDYSVVITYAIPIEEAKSKLPYPLEPDTYNSRFAFVAIAMVRCRNLRPAFLPKWLGKDFNLTGYRIFSVYRDKEQRRKRGLYILKSSTDRTFMKFFGRFLSRYKYEKESIEINYNNGEYCISNIDKTLLIRCQEVEEPALPKESPFNNWLEARKFSGPLPFTFSIDKEQDELLIIEGVRSNWKPIPLLLLEHQVPFMNNFSAIPASAFVVKNIPYSWKKGRIEQIHEI